MLNSAFKVRLWLVAVRRWVIRRVLLPHQTLCLSIRFLFMISLNRRWLITSYQRKIRSRGASFVPSRWSDQRTLRDAFCIYFRKCSFLRFRHFTVGWFLVGYTNCLPLAPGASWECVKSLYLQISLQSLNCNNNREMRNQLFSHAVNIRLKKNLFVPMMFAYQRILRQLVDVFVHFFHKCWNYRWTRQENF